MRSLATFFRIDLRMFRTWAILPEQPQILSQMNQPSLPLRQETPLHIDMSIHEISKHPSNIPHILIKHPLSSHFPTSSQPFNIGISNASSSTMFQPWSFWVTKWMSPSAIFCHTGRLFSCSILSWAGKARLRPGEWCFLKYWEQIGMTFDCYCCFKHI